MSRTRTVTKKALFKTLLAVGVTSILMVNAGCSRKTEEKHLNIAIQPSGAFLPMYVVRENGWLEEELAKKQIKVNWFDFESGPPINESLASRSTDIGFLGDVPTVSAIAAGRDNFVFGIATRAPEHYAALVAGNSAINSTDDFKNKKIGTVVGSAAHNLLKKFLAKSGLGFDDIELLNVSPGDTQTVLATGLVDAVITWEPNIIRAVDSGVARTVASGADADLLGVNTIVVRHEYAEENREILKEVLKQYERGAGLLSELDDQSLTKLGKPLHLTADQIRKIIPKYDYSTVIDDSSVHALQDTIDFLVHIGVLKESYDISNHLVKE